ncbi:hypothetical protein NP493_77g02034 [Ridgeia piscesae]|uniref:EGF-like domain-containing protein n=1 Tax=Ridgeia piscesae TaxID=27915 RepID=A0AAD9UIB1_RIDPI|nr:hypothetical protein NP493_77g02034 [Ridgeia piscesae]
MSSTRRTTAVSTTRRTTAVPTYAPGSCQPNPCKNNGRCVALPGNKYQCVCRKCGCSTTEPYGDCVIDESTICKDEDPSATTYLVAHPYLCTKFYDCKPGVTYKREQDVYMAINGDHVFNPYTDDSDFRKNVNCSTEIGTFCYMYVTI